MTAILPLTQLVDGSAYLHQADVPHISGDCTWNSFGVRDPSVLIDQCGNCIVDENGQITMFFNARNSMLEKGGTCVGMARGTPESIWSVYPTPVFSDGPYAAQGSVVQLTPNDFRMYYSPDTLLGFAVASSMDGITWKKLGDRLILKPGDFGIRRMGLPFVRKVHEDWIMLFEGTDNGQFHIYQALSTDGVDWHPANGGRPIYSPKNSSWDAFGQANPSLYVELDICGRARYFILYNGCSSLHGWDIGILTADSLDGPWRGITDPILRRGSHGTWNAGRLEGARLVALPNYQPYFVYFGLPGKDSYAQGKIAFAPLSLKENSTKRKYAVELSAKAETAFNDKLADRYFAIWDNYPIQKFTTKIESILMDEVITPSSKVLLLGSGGGRELPVLLKNRCEITAIDISPQMLAAGRARYPEAGVCWIEADLHHLPSSLVGFDTAVCLGAVFNYLHNPSAFLLNTYRSLKPGGNLIIAVINAMHPSEKKMRTEFPDGRVRQLYDLPAIKYFLKSAGFRVVSDRGVRFLVDLLPAEWNRNDVNEQTHLGILEKMLHLEERLCELLPSAQGKFILIHAVSAG
jgi:ubiquinone/menaquinone biosynthesis C-methylase UbiE